MSPPINLEEIRSQLLNPEQETRMQALALLRKQALKKLDFSCLTAELVAAFETGTPELKTLILKLAENILKGLPYGTRETGHLAMLKLQLALYLPALKDPLALNRKTAIYGLHRLLGRYRDKGGLSWLHDNRNLAAVAPLISDSGCDLDVSQYDHPLTTKGTLTIAEAAAKTLYEFPGKADYSPVFYQVITGLETLHMYMSNGLLDAAYGDKLVAQIIDVFASLVTGQEAPLPVSRFPDTYPNYLVELICFTQDSTYHTISDSSIYRLLRPLVQSKRHTGALIATLEVDDYPEVKASILRMLVEKRSYGESLKWCLPRIQAAIASGKLEGVDIPEDLQQWLEAAESPAMKNGSGGASG